MMQLNFEQIRSVTLGAVRFEQSDEGIRFYRFTPEQHQLYSEKTVGLFEKSQATAGVKFCFRTDSTKLFFKALFQNAYCRSYFSVDVFANDKPVGYLDNFSGQELPQDYSNISFPVGVFSKEFDLGEGVKTVTVHLPWNKKVALQALSLDDGAFIEPVKPEKNCWHLVIPLPRVLILCDLQGGIFRGLPLRWMPRSLIRRLAVSAMSQTCRR